jgi:hypothetical protein
MPNYLSLASISKNIVITIISNSVCIYMMTTSIRTRYTVGIITAVLFGVWTQIMTNSAGPIAFVSSPLSAAASSVGDQGAAKMHVDEAMKSLQAGDTAGAKMHAQAAQDSL